MMPSCPCVVNGSSATSVTTPSSGTSCLIARTARCARPSGFQASRPSRLLASGAVTGNSAMAGTPRRARSSRFAHEFVDREALDARHRRNRHARLDAFHHEHGIDEIARRQRRLAHHAARKVVAPHAAHAHAGILARRVMVCHLMRNSGSRALYLTGRVAERNAQSTGAVPASQNAAEPARAYEEVCRPSCGARRPKLGRPEAEDCRPDEQQPKPSRRLLSCRMPGRAAAGRIPA